MGNIPWAGYFVTDKDCFLMLVNKVWWSSGWGLNEFYFKFCLNIESFLRRINLGLFSVIWSEFCIKAMVFCWEIVLNFYLALLDKEQSGLRTLFFYIVWIFSDLYPLTFSSYFLQGSSLCLILIYLISDKANFSGQKLKNNPFFNIYLAFKSN
jgi:hypothetical protein